MSDWPPHSEECSKAHTLIRVGPGRYIDPPPDPKSAEIRARCPFCIAQAEYFQKKYSGLPHEEACKE